MICTVKVSKPDGNQVNVNVKHLIPLELFCELNTPNVVNEDGPEDDSLQEFEPFEEVSSEVPSDPEEDSSPTVVEEAVASRITSGFRPSRKTVRACRAQTRALVSEGLL